MEWSILVEILGAGGVVYLLVDKFFLGKKDKVGINKDVLGNGVQLVDLYNQMRDVVKKEVSEEVALRTKPLENKIDNLTNMLEQWGCSRPKEECDRRIPVFYSDHIKEKK